MDPEKIALSLSDVERRVIHTISKKKSVDEIVEATGLAPVEVMRALQFLSNKGVVRLTSQERETVVLTERGRRYIREPLPERKLINILKDGNVPVKEAAAKLGDEFKVAIGILRREGLVSLEDGFVKLVGTPPAKFPWERYISKPEDAPPDIRYMLIQRGLARVEKTKVWFVEPTSIWKEVVSKIPSDLVEGMTPEILRTGEWKGKKFRAYDVVSPIPRAYPGRRHPYLEFLHRVRLKMISIGFREMKRGDIVLPSFWNSEILFMPQDHPASEIGAGDIYTLAAPKKYGSVPDEIYEKVKASHERSWGYRWSDEAAKRLVLRSHATALSALTLYEKPEIPGRYFTISRVFRPDQMDASHLPEFTQLDGIVLDETITFRNLVGVLKEFAREFTGTDRIRVVPGYFPFTEPSAEMYVKHPDLGWMEVAGAGMFREELLEPLGIDVPVIAWGLGIDRLAMIALGVDDIRYLFSSDLEWIRKSRKVWVI